MYYYNIHYIIGAFGTGTKGTGGLGSWRTSGDHPNDSIIENGQNIVYYYDQKIRQACDIRNH